MENSMKDSTIRKLKNVIDSPEDENETAIAKSESLKKMNRLKCCLKHYKIYMISRTDSIEWLN